MVRELLGKTKNGLDVYIDIEKSHALTHFAKNPNLKESIIKILPEIEADEDVIRQHYRYR